MSEIRSFGLQYIKIGAAEQFAVMEALGVTYKDTAELVDDDATETEIESEENDDPELVITRKGKTRVRWNIMNVAPAALVKALGGTISVVDGKDTWEQPDTAPNLENSIEMKTSDGTLIRVAKAKLLGKKNFKFSKAGVLVVEITATVLKPSAASALKSLTITEP